ncbi:hypothetical protein AALB53_03115 [Lachnospiraceae bacterium 47-T17]
MAAYTDFLEDKSYSILDAEDYIEELKKAVGLFRTFDQALDTFLAGHGFEGSFKSVDEKVTFLADKLKEAGIPVPRNMKKWYAGHRRIERKTAFQICFAFGLDAAGADDFLRRVCLERGFDCHSMEEVVYFYAFKNGLSYGEAMDLLSQVPSVKPARMEGEHIVYTSLIAERINEIETSQELVSYLNEHASEFGYNNATAYDEIRTIWEAISGPDGIAARERRHLYAAFQNVREERTDLTETDGRKGRRQRKRPDGSIWEIYLQMLGLSGDYTADFNKDRSIKPILKDNALLHPLAEDSFPDRDGLNKILRGEHVSYERVRKLLILLVFYCFWANRALKQHSYEAGYEDADRCMAEIHAHLTDAGYPLLYPGNPYDFLFLMSANSECPLITFREYMRELFFQHSFRDCDGETGNGAR